jgi:hypothetical protein
MSQKIINFFFSLTIILIIFSIFGSALYFKFNVIDDHQVVALLGTDNYLDFSEFKKHILDTVIQIKNSNIRIALGQFWHTLEIFFFQDNVGSYYFFNLFLISIFFVILFIYTSQFIGKYFSFLLIVLLISSKSIFDIVTRIYIGEIFTLAALIFLIPLIFKFIKYLNYSNFEQNLSKIDIFFYFFFFNFFFFSKENLIPFIIFPILFIYFHFKNKLNNKTFLLINFFNIFFFIIYCYLNFFLIYKDPSVLKGIITLDLKNYARIAFKFIKYCLIYYSIHILIISYIFFKHRSIINLSRLYLIFSISLVIIFFQFVIHNGNLPSNIRYDLILDLLLYFNSLFLIIYLKKINFFFKKFKILTICFLFLFSLCVFKINYFYSTYKAVSQKKNDTIYFQSIINNIKVLSENNPDDKIVITSTNVWDYELVSSIFKFLKYNNVNNKIFLILNYTEKDMKNELEKIFYDRLNDVSFQNKKINNWVHNPKREWGFNSQKDFDKNYNCIELIIYQGSKKETKNKNCNKFISYYR